MINEIFRLRYIFVLFIAIFLLFFYVKSEAFISTKEEASLVVFGENIKTTVSPYVKDGAIYVGVNTIYKTISDTIVFDKISSKVIVTSYNDVIKFGIGEKKMSKNLEYVDIENPAELKDSEAFLDINYLKDMFNIDVEYNPDQKVISIDKKDTEKYVSKYNLNKVYSKLSTDSDVLQNLSRKDEVFFYPDSLSNPRWIKIKTSRGVVGYAFKTSFNNVENKSSVANENTIANAKKIMMFWQYGNDLSIMGKTKIEGVNVVSPTWYELKNSNGEISSKFNVPYYTQAKNNGYKIWPIITNGIDSANYSPFDTSNMLNSEYNREQFIKNILDIVKRDNVDGINIDFENMKAEDRDAFTQFIRELAPLMRKIGKTLSVDTYFVAYIDRASIGAAADYIVLMGYDQRGSWSSSSGSIAEVSWVEKNIESLINDSKIPAEKIILGIPFYTRLWIEKVGDDKPTTNIYSMNESQSFINKYGLSKTWDEAAGQNYVEMTKGDLKYKLWVEDADSVKKRIESVNKYKLAGVAAWKKGFETDDIWDVINSNLNAY